MLIDELRNRLKMAMKEKDKHKMDVLKLVIANIINEKIKKMSDLTQDEEMQILRREIKQMKETIQMASSTRKDIVDINQEKIKFLETFLPAQMSDDEVKKVVNETIVELGIVSPQKSDMGKIMKSVMSKLKGRTSNNVIHDIVVSKLV